MSPALQADSSLSEPPEKPAVGEAKRGAGCTCFPNQRETFLALKFNNFSALLTADPGKSCFILFSPPFNLLNSWVGKIPLRREKLPTSVFWPGEFHGQYSPRDCKESNATE